ncbi:zinc uptake protein ZrgA [Grimontia sp. NTOU-MAR1]|uniref:zinc uptake protein ZrgA n=1 Tax=Grimontia sp. NTOU-MAR1 TaxID=3111011 RepID=UPI002DBA280F|nr:DUF2796 domain-containing protein [Grimontia sp. NTOU-MAR1]WRV99621.1 DUF2796 domain-containing protein [Grimontia sp. NTOU-MAR1]
MRTKHLFALSAIALGVTSAASAENHEFRQHDAHQHGVVEWHIAQDGDELLAEITAPGSDVVGFEHAPENAEQKAAIEKAVAALAKPGALFAINAEAGCELEAQQVTHTLDEDDHDGHDNHDKHDEHDDHTGHDHDKHDDHHDDHKGHDHHDDHHDEHKGHDHDEHDHGHDHKKAQHGEFSAQYTFHCKAPDKIQSITTDWFTAFGNTEKISVQAVTDKGVVAQELLPSSTTFRF